MAVYIASTQKGIAFIGIIIIIIQATFDRNLAKILLVGQGTHTYEQSYILSKQICFY